MKVIYLSTHEYWITGSEVDEGKRKGHLPNTFTHTYLKGSNYQPQNTINILYLSLPPPFSLTPPFPLPLSPSFKYHVYPCFSPRDSEQSFSFDSYYIHKNQFLHNFIINLRTIAVEMVDGLSDKERDLR